MIRDQIVFGIGDKKIRERLLRETELKLEGAVKICHASELTKKHVQTFSEAATSNMNVRETADVGAISKLHARQGRASGQKTVHFQCKRCGTQHKPRECPAFGKQCSICQGKNHFARQCFSKRKEKQKGKSVNIMEDTDSGHTLFVGMVNNEEEPKTQINAVEADKWIAPLQINGTIITLKLDTGAKANLISMSDVKAMRKKTPKIQKKTLALKDYNGQSIECLGTYKLKVAVKDKVHHLLFSIVPEGLDSLLGDKACENLELVKRVYRINTSITDSPDSANVIVQDFSDIFRGFGVLPFTDKIQLKDKAQPVVHAARRVPLALRDSLKKELERTTALGVIKKIEEPTEWANSMVCVKKKNGELRMCMDPKDLNENIKHEHYQIPKRGEMAGAKYFSKLDA